MPEQSNILTSLINKRPLLLIFLLFLLVQAMILYKVGIVTGLEAQKYITEGNNLYETGRFSASKYVFYLPVILLVYLCRLTGASYGLVVAVQVALSGIALLCFYRLAKKISNPATAFLAAVLLAIFIPLQTWNFLLYSDSIFISFSVIYIYILSAYGDKGWRGALVIFFFLGLLIISRPHGLLFIPPTIIYFLFRKQTRPAFAASLGISVLLLACMYLFLNAAFTGGGDMDAMKPFIEEHIICFVPMKPEGATLNVVHTSNPVHDIFYYIFHNPLHFLRLMGLKLLSFFNMTRSYYTPLHNILLAVFFIPVYLFSLLGLFRFPKTHRNLALFIISLLILYPVGATFQCDDWHSRFTMVVFPYFILLASLGVDSLARKKPAKPL